MTKKAQQATDEARKKIEAISKVDQSLEDYIECMEELESLVSASIDAARDDIRRRDT